MSILRVLSRKALCLLADNLFHLAGRLIRGFERGVVGQPHIDVSPILDVLRKERGVQAGKNEGPQSKEGQGSDKKLPTVFDRVLCRSRIQAEKSAVAPLLERFL